MFYRHYIAKEDATAEVADSWVRLLISTKGEGGTLYDKQIGGIEVIVIILLLLLILGICFWYRYGLRKKRKDNASKKSEHIEMIEEQFQTVALSDRVVDEGNKSNEKEN